jgi:predicted dehydrogenase
MVRAQGVQVPDPLRALVVGLGSIGRRHARNWAALGLGPVAVCRQTNTTQPEPLGIDAREFRDLDEALDDRPDVVLVTNPTSLHVATACKAVQAGAHVFVEKPISHTLEGVAHLLSEAERSQKLLMVGYNLRFHPGLARLRQLLEHGAIGKTVSARAEAGEYLPDWHPWEDYRTSYSGRAGLGGGALLTFSHELDSLCWVLGAPSRVAAIAAHASSLEIDTEDVGELILQFPNGPLASVHVDYLRRPPSRSLEIVGEEGLVRWEYDASRVLSYAPGTRQWRVEEGDRRLQRNDMYLAELAHFAACVRGEVEGPLIDGEQGAAILGITLAALKSSHEGRAIDLMAEGEPLRTWLSSLGPWPHG